MGAEGPAGRWVWATVAVTAGALALGPLLAPPASAPPGVALRWVLVVGSSGHVASTAWLYFLAEVRAEARRRPARYIWVPLGLIAGAAVVAAVVPAESLTWLLLPYFGWQFWHFHKQNLGIVAAALVVGIRSVARRPPEARPPHYWVVYGMSLVFWVPVMLFRSPYAAVAGLTVAHGLQYLLLVGLVAAGPRESPTGVPNIMALVVVVCVLGSVLSLTSHLHGGAGGLRFLYGAYLGIVMSHFVIDARMWRLRDAFPRHLVRSRIPWMLPASVRCRWPMDRQPI